jgi:hypothetical protein
MHGTGTVKNAVEWSGPSSRSVLPLYTFSSPHADKSKWGPLGTWRDHGIVELGEAKVD